MRNQNRFGKLRFSYAWFVAAMIGLASIASCSSGGCGNCTVPAFHAPTPSPIPVVATPTPTPLPPGVTPTPTPPGVTPTPTATPTSTPTPTPTPVPPPVALSCAANPAGVPLGTAANFAILGAAGVTNTGPSIITGDLGTFPTASVVGFTTSAITGPGIVIGAIHAADAVAGQGQTDLTAAYNTAAGKASTVAAPADIGGLVLAPGVYKSTSTLAITGNVTLDSQGNPNAVFVFQIASGLTANVGSSVTLVGGNPCNIYWQVGSSATLNGASFSGNVFALASVTVGANNIINGRLLARTGAVTLISDAVTKPGP